MTQENTQDTPSANAAPAGAIDWEARFKGLQVTLNETQRQLREMKASKDATIAEMTQELQSVRGKVLDTEDREKKASDLLSKLQAERDEALKNAATFEKGLKRKDALGEFPALFPHEAKGLLRTDLEGDDFKSYLKNFYEAIGAAEKGALESALAGAAPTGGAVRTGPQTKADVKAAMQVAQQKGDMKEYDRLYDQLVSGDLK